MVGLVKPKMQENPCNVPTVHNHVIQKLKSATDSLLQNDICLSGHTVYNEISYVI